MNIFIMSSVPWIKQQKAYLTEDPLYIYVLSTKIKLHSSFFTIIDIQMLVGLA